MTDELIGLVLVLGMGALVSGAFWYFSESATVRRELRAVSRLSIKDVGDGVRARIVGTARVVDDALVAPLSGRRCMCYVAVIEEDRRTSGVNRWREIVREERSCVFAVDDGTGHAIVDMTGGARLALDLDVHSRSGLFDSADAAQMELLQRNGEKPDRWLFNRTLRYREAVITEGMVVSVLGSGVVEPDPRGSPDAEYRGRPPMRLRLTGSPRHPLLVSDHTNTTT